MQRLTATTHLRSGKQVFIFLSLMHFVFNAIGKDCRSKSTGYLAKKFANPKAAERHYQSLFQSGLSQSPLSSDQSRQSSCSSEAVLDLSQSPSLIISCCCSILSKLKAHE